MGGISPPRQINGSSGEPLSGGPELSAFPGFWPKIWEAEKSNFQGFRPGTAPPGPRTLKIAKIRSEICLPTNSQPELSSEWQILGGPFPAAVSRRRNRKKKKQRILTISPTKNPGNATERRVLKSYHDGFQSQTKRCHLSQVMLISVLDKRFWAGITCLEKKKP